MVSSLSTELLKRLLQKNPDSLVFAHLAANLIDEGDYQQAIEICQKNLEKHSQYAFGHFVLGIAHYHVKNYTDAKKHLEKSLAYDPNNPKAWETLSAINEILNLQADAKESNVQAYLIDLFKTDASLNYLPVVETPEFEWKAEVLEIDQMKLEEKKPVTEELGEEKLSEILGESLSKDQEEYDFEKALSEVFQDKEEDTIPTARPDETISEIPTEMPSPGETADQSNIISAQEFTSEIESFFSTYDEGKFPPESTAEAFPPEKKLDESTLETSKIPEVTIPETSPTSEIPEERISEELLDFKSFISDVIKDKDQAATEERVAKEDRSAKTEEKKEEFIKEEDFIFPEKPAEKPPSPQKIVEVDKIDISISAEKKAPGKRETTKVSKPPILSPTLGEIYIAQGRFEEAIEVFNQLLQKDPQNSRFKRKIEDLQKIMSKRNLGT